VEVDLVGLGQGDVFDEEPGHALAFALGGGGVGPQGREVGGQTTSLVIPIPPTGWQARQTDPDVLALLDRLLDDHTDAEVADALNAAGHRSGAGKTFTRLIVLHLRRAHQLPTHAERLRTRGLLTMDEIAGRLHVHRSTIKAWHHAGMLVSHKANDKNERLYEPPTPGDPRLVKRMGSRLAKRTLIESTPGGAV
jgi:DNA-binding transcriptional regulator YiaG